jgi:hypothetical protein
MVLYSNMPKSYKTTLNACCNEITTEHLQKSDTVWSRVPFIPDKAVYNSQSKECQSLLTIPLCTSIGFPMSKLAMHTSVTTNQWNTNTCESINWELFSTTLVSLAFGHWLGQPSRSFGLLSESYHPHHTPDYCFCDEPIEDNYMLSCSHSERYSILKDQLVQLPKLYDQWHMDPCLSSTDGASTQHTTNIRLQVD